MQKTNICPACNAKPSGVKSRIAFEHTCGKELQINSHLERELESVQIRNQLKPVLRPSDNWYAEKLERAIQLLKQVRSIPNSLFPYQVLKGSIDEFLKSVNENPPHEQ